MLILYPSAIDQYLACGHAYRLKYILKEPGAVSLPMLVGAAFHKIIHADAVAYKEEQQFLPFDVLMDTGRAYLLELMNRPNTIDLKGEPVELAYQDAIVYLTKLIKQYTANVRQIRDYAPTETEIKLTGTMYCDYGPIILNARVDILCGPVLWEFKAKKAQGKVYMNKSDGNIQINTYMMLLEYAGVKNPSAVLCCIKPMKVHTANVKLSNRSRTRTSLLIQAAARGIDAGIFLPAVQDETKSHVCEYCDYRTTCCYTLFKNRLQGGLEMKEENENN